jgi:hypothetical protein
MARSRLFLFVESSYDRSPLIIAQQDFNATLRLTKPLLAFA